MCARIYHRDMTDSTQQDARKLVSQGKACHGDICTASYQNAGRGRIAGRIWEGEKDQSLMLTLILEKKKIPPTPPLSLILGLAAALTMEKYGLTPAVKWPNDIYLDEKKSCGILCESEKNFFLCGMGINLNQKKFSGELNTKAVSLRQILGQKIDPALFLNNLQNVIHQLLTGQPADILENLQKRLHWMNKEKTLLLGDPAKQEKVKGIIRGINQDGALLFEEKGTVKKIYSAEFL